MEAETYHVLVAGGGLSGLTAARSLLTKSQNITVTVLEADDYLGGRTKSGIINNCKFDLGGSFIGPTQKHAI